MSGKQHMDNCAGLAAGPALHIHGPEQLGTGLESGPQDELNDLERARFSLRTASGRQVTPSRRQLENAARKVFGVALAEAGSSTNEQQQTGDAQRGSGGAWWQRPKPGSRAARGSKGCGAGIAQSAGSRDCKGSTATAGTVGPDVRAMFQSPTLGSTGNAPKLRRVGDAQSSRGISTPVAASVSGVAAGAQTIDDSAMDEDDTVLMSDGKRKSGRGRPSGAGSWRSPVLTAGSSRAGGSATAGGGGGGRSDPSGPVNVASLRSSWEQMVSKPSDAAQQGDDEGGTVVGRPSITSHIRKALNKVQVHALSTSCGAAAVAKAASHANGTNATMPSPRIPEAVMHGSTQPGASAGEPEPSMEGMEVAVEDEPAIDDADAEADTDDDGGSDDGADYSVGGAEGDTGGQAGFEGGEHLGDAAELLAPHHSWPLVTVTTADGPKVCLLQPGLPDPLGALQAAGATVDERHSGRITGRKRSSGAGA